MDNFKILDYSLPIIGFLMIYVLNGIKTELKDLKTTIKYDKFLTINVNDISKLCHL